MQKRSVCVLFVTLLPALWLPFFKITVCLQNPTCGALLNIDRELWLFRQTSQRLPDVVDPSSYASPFRPALRRRGPFQKVGSCFIFIRLLHVRNLSRFLFRTTALWVGFMLTIRSRGYKQFNDVNCVSFAKWHCLPKDPALHEFFTLWLCGRFTWIPAL